MIAVPISNMRTAAQKIRKSAKAHSQARFHRLRRFSVIHGRGLSRKPAAPLRLRHVLLLAATMDCDAVIYQYLLDLSGDLSH